MYKIVPKYLTVTLAFVLAVFVNNAAMAKQWAFDVYLNQSKIGSHTFDLSDTFQLTSTADFKVKVFFINAYQYQHTALEQWQGDCLSSLEAHTIENKVTTLVSGILTQDVFMVDAGKAKQKLPACSMTFAYWNRKIIGQEKLLNPQNAEWLDTKFTDLGTQTIVVKGEKVAATHYKLLASAEGKSKLKIELWYGAQNDWLALKSTTPEGYVIEYKLR
jgi:hypothetical protein